MLQALQQLSECRWSIFTDARTRPHRHFDLLSQTTGSGHIDTADVDAYMQPFNHEVDQHVHPCSASPTTIRFARLLCTLNIIPGFYRGTLVFVDHN